MAFCYHRSSDTPKPLPQAQTGGHSFVMFFCFFVMSGKNSKKPNDYKKFSDMSCQEKRQALMDEADAFINEYNDDFACLAKI